MSSRHSIPYTFYPCFSYTTEQQWGGKGYAKPMQREAENPYVDTECKDIVKGLHRKKTPSLQGRGGAPRSHPSCNDLSSCQKRSEN